MYTLNGSVVRLFGELSCIAAHWILYSEFGLVSCIDLFFDVNLDVKLIHCRTSSKVEHSGKVWSGKVWTFPNTTRQVV